MSVRLLKEVLDDFNVTYEVSEKKCDLIVKVCQARERLQESHCVILHCIITMTIRMTSHTGITAAHSRPLCSRWFITMTEKSIQIDSHKDESDQFLSISDINQLITIHYDRFLSSIKNIDYICSE